MANTKLRIFKYIQDNKEASVNEIADNFNITPQNVHSHVKQLRDNGLIKFKKIKKEGNIKWSYLITI